MGTCFLGTTHWSWPPTMYAFLLKFMYAWMHACLYVFMYVCMHDVYIYACMLHAVSMNARLLYVSMCVCMLVVCINLPHTLITARDSADDAIRWVSNRIKLVICDTVSRSISLNRSQNAYYTHIINNYVFIRAWCM